MKMSESATGNYMTCKDIVNKAHVRVEKSDTCKPSPRQADGRLKDFSLALLNTLERAKENLV